MLVLNETATDDVLLDRLAGLDEAGLARVLGSRAGALDPPWPRRLEDLARRLSSPDSILLALRALPLPGFQVVRAIRLVTALRGEPGVEVAELAGWLGATVPDITPILDSLADHALAWADGAGRAWTPPSHEVIGMDFGGLGPSITEYLPQRNVEQLKAMSAELGVSAGGRKDQILDRMLAFFRDQEKIRALLAGAPDGTKELLTDFAWNGPELKCYLGNDSYNRYHVRGHEPVSPARWAARRGLLWGNYEGIATMPLEVGLAMRGPDYRLPFTPEPPSPGVTPVSAEQVQAESPAAALRLVDRICAVLDHSATQPIPLLKGGRVGARAIKTMAKSTSSTADETRLAVELAIRMMLLAPADVEPAPPATRSKRRSRTPAEPVPPAELVPAERHTAWQRAGSADRLRSALCAWWTLPLAPLGDEKLLRSVLGDDSSAAYTDLRQLTVRLITQLPDGTGVRDAESLVELVAWHAPLASPDLVGTLVSAALAEATLLGVIAAGAAGELAGALIDATAQHGRPVHGDPALVRVTEQLVATARTTALFGADLTAVVTGPPDAELAGLLDRLAERETKGAASTWRFSPTSVRRAFDNGASASALLDELREVAQKPLPQPLEYLINDVARRHGEIGVISVGCVVVGEEPGLLAEIAVHRKLAALCLRSVAPTVLVATAAADETVAALREAGYAPVRRGPDGTVVVRSTNGARQESTIPAQLAESSPMEAPDPREHAARLRGGPVRSGGRGMRRGVLTDVLYRSRGDRLNAEWMQFAWHLEAGLPTSIGYREPDGQLSKLVVCDAELHGDAIDVWCEPTSGYRRLELARVTPNDL